MAKRQVVQRCPNCSVKYDVSLFTSGAKVRCRHCGIKFTVQREDTQPGGPGGGRAGVVAPRPASKRPSRTAQNFIPPGTVLASAFEVGRQIGKGAMGSVYEGTQRSLERKVAIKVMSDDLAGQEEFRLRFRREAAALAQLSHPNVVAIVDQGTHDGWYFLVMEFVEGPTLRSVIADRRLPHELRKAFTYAIQVGHGMSYAHGKGIIHRDLKPENVLLAHFGDEQRHKVVPKICDFGLADLLESNRSYANLTGSRISMGTVNYMAPEQRQDAGRVDQRADIFSYGVMVYEMLTGSLPLGRFPLASKKNPGVHPNIDGPLMRSLEPNAKTRLGAVRELVEALEANPPTLRP